MLLFLIVLLTTLWTPIANAALTSNPTDSPQNQDNIIDVRELIQPSADYSGLLAKLEDSQEPALELTDAEYWQFHALLLDKYDDLGALFTAVKNDAQWLDMDRLVLCTIVRADLKHFEQILDHGFNLNKIAPSGYTYYQMMKSTPELVFAGLKRERHPDANHITCALTLIPETDASLSSRLEDWVTQTVTANPQLLEQHTFLGATLLNIAAEKGLVDLCKIFVSLGADPNLKSIPRIYATPLIAAMEQPDLEKRHACIRLLLEHGANPNLNYEKPHTQASALTKAALDDDLVAFQLLAPHCSAQEKMLAILYSLHAYSQSAAESSVLSFLPFQHAVIGVHPFVKESYLTLYMQRYDNYQHWANQPKETREHINTYLNRTYIHEACLMIKELVNAPTMPTAMWTFLGGVMLGQPNLFNAIYTDKADRSAHLQKVITFLAQDNFAAAALDFILKDIDSADRIGQYDEHIKQLILKTCDNVLASNLTQEDFQQTLFDLITDKQFIAADNEHNEQIVSFALIGLLSIYHAQVKYFDIYMEGYPDKDDLCAGYRAFCSDIAAFTGQPHLCYKPNLVTIKLSPEQQENALNGLPITINVQPDQISQ